MTCDPWSVIRSSCRGEVSWYPWSQGRDPGAPGARSNRRSFAALRMTNSTCGLVLSHPSEAWMGHPFSWWVEGVRGNRRSFDSLLRRLAQDDKFNMWARAIPPKRSLDGAHISCGGLRAREATAGPSTRCCGDSLRMTNSTCGLVLSHPSEAWMGHPFLWWVEGWKNKCRSFDSGRLAPQATFAQDDNSFEISWKTPTPF